MIKDESLFGVSKKQLLDFCSANEFPGTKKWPSDNPIWNCYIAGKISPREAWNSQEYLMKAIDNLFYIVNYSIKHNKYLDFVAKIKRALEVLDNDILELVLNRFTIAKIAPKVTALQKHILKKIILESHIDISNGVYCPMAGFGGIIEGCYDILKDRNHIEAYDINKDLCDYYGWIQKDVLSKKVKTDKIVIACPPFGTNTERWPGTPDNMYYEFEEWCKLIKEYIEAPNYILIGPELKKSGRHNLFSKKIGIQYYPEYSL